MQMVEQTPTEIKQIDDNLLNYLKVQMVVSLKSKTDADFEAAQKKITTGLQNTMQNV